jgi:hypothetical protein
LRCFGSESFSCYVCGLLIDCACVCDSFEDEEVLDVGFKQRLGDLARVMRPLVHWYAVDFLL